jgi:hypothetical protein
MPQIAEDLTSDVSEDLQLPNVNELPPNVALLMMGRAVAEAYKGTVEEPMPAALAEVLRKLERLER